MKRGFNRGGFGGWVVLRGDQGGRIGGFGVVDHVSADCSSLSVQHNIR